MERTWGTRLGIMHKAELERRLEIQTAMGFQMESAAVARSTQMIMKTPPIQIGHSHRQLLHRHLEEGDLGEFPAALYIGQVCIKVHLAVSCPTPIILSSEQEQSDPKV